MKSNGSIVHERRRITNLLLNACNPCPELQASGRAGSPPSAGRALSTSLNIIPLKSNHEPGGGHHGPRMPSLQSTLYRSRFCQGGVQKHGGGPEEVRLGRSP